MLDNKTLVQKRTKKANKRKAKRRELYLKSLNISADTKAKQLREKALAIIASNPVLKAKYIEQQAKEQEVKE